MANANPPYDDDDDFTSSPLISPDESRRNYLVTYSRADMIRFPDRDSFAKCVLEAFEQEKSTARVVQGAWQHVLKTIVIRTINTIIWQLS